MRPFENLKTEVIRNILSAYTASYGRFMTAEESNECQKTIELINMELEFRKENSMVPERIVENYTTTSLKQLTRWL